MNINKCVLLFSVVLCILLFYKLSQKETFQGETTSVTTGTTGTTAAGTTAAGTTAGSRVSNLGSVGTGARGTLLGGSSSAFSRRFRRRQAFARPDCGVICFVYFVHHGQHLIFGNFERGET